jgi:hypothetical protein
MDNQTEEAWLTGVSDKDVGTGLFVFPSKHDPDFGPRRWSRSFDSPTHGSMTKALRGEITYSDGLLLGTRTWVTAFKWIPESLASYQAVEKAAESCRPVLCVQRCAGYGCACVAGQCK